MAQDRKPTDIEVEVIDLSDAYAYVLDRYREQASDNIGSESYDPQFRFVIGFKHLWRVARYRAPNGDLYVLDEEGVGYADPVTDATPAHLPVHKVAVQPQPPKKQMVSMFPASELTLFPADVLNAPVIERINLSEFIHTSGSRRLRNYEEWREALEAASKRG